MAGSDGESSAAIHCPHGGEDGGGVCVPPTPTCASYCDTITANCTDANAQYADHDACMAYCQTWASLEAGTAADTDVNTIGCRTYHAGVAADDPGLHCDHAGPSGGGVCGTWCDNYCDLMDHNCTGANAQYSWYDHCQNACAFMDDTDVAGATGGNTVQCRIYHAGVAGSDVDNGSAATHCPHAGESGDGVCASAAIGDGGEACADAVPIDTFPATAAGDLDGAANDHAPSAGCPGWVDDPPVDDPDEVYSFTPPQSGSYAIEIEGADIVYVASDCDDMPATCVGYIDTVVTDGPLVVDLTAGTQYFIIVSVYDALWGLPTYTLDISTACLPFCPDGAECGSDLCGGTCGPPEGCDGGFICDSQVCVDPATIEGNICDTAFEIAGLPYSNSSDTTVATADFSSSQCGAIFAGGASTDHVYKLPVSDTWLYEVIVTPTGWDATLYGADTCEAEPTCGFHTDDGFGGDVESATLALHAGTDFYFFVDGWSDSSPQSEGAYDITVDYRAPSCDDYCTVITDNCADADAQYADKDACLDACTTANWDPGEIAETGSDTISCRTYHAIVAGSDPGTSEAIHCPHAGADGGGGCVTP